MRFTSNCAILCCEQRALTPLLEAVLEPPWSGGIPPGDEGGRPDIESLVLAQLEGLPGEASALAAGANRVPSSVYTIARL